MDNKVTSLFDEEKIKERVNKVWDAVFAASNKIIVQAQKYGFHGIEAIPNPNIHVILGQLRIFSAVMGSLVGDEALEYEETRLILNAKEQLMRMERIAIALVAGNREDYDEAISALERQATF